MQYVTTLWTTIAVLAIAGTAPIQSQQLTVSGQLRPRMEARSMTDHSDEFTTMRARVSLRAPVAPVASIFFEAQDVRMWGSELSTTANPDRIELHQGYLDIGVANAALAGRVGRQEISYGEERLVGASDWTQQARSFDGVRGRYQQPHVTLDAFAYQIADGSDPTVTERFFGSYATCSSTPLGSVEAYLFHNRAEATLSTRQTTLGTRLSATRGAVGYRVEAATQIGTRKGTDVRAFMGTARVTLSAKRHAAQLTAWYDYLSGDDDPADSELHTFDTVYGTNHKFYGTADLFTNIPLHTGNRGLQDMAIKSAINVSRDVTVNTDLHQFHAAASRGLAAADFGREADVNAVYRWSPKLAVNAGASYYAHGDGLDAIHRALPSQGFTYIMLNATF